MSASVDRFDERARREADRFGETIVHRGELLRHPVYTRMLHWAVAIFFVLSLSPASRFIRPGSFASCRRYSEAARELVCFIPGSACSSNCFSFSNF